MDIPLPHFEEEIETFLYVLGRLKPQRKSKWLGFSTRFANLELVK